MLGRMRTHRSIAVLTTRLADNPQLFPVFFMGQRNTVPRKSTQVTRVTYSTDSRPSGGGMYPVGRMYFDLSSGSSSSRTLGRWNWGSGCARNHALLPGFFTG